MPVGQTLNISREKKGKPEKTARLQRFNLCPSAGPVFADRPRPTSPSVLTNPGGQVVRASSFQLQRRSSYWRLGPPVAAAAKRGRAVQSTDGDGDRQATPKVLGPMYPCSPVPPCLSIVPSTSHTPGPTTGLIANLCQNLAGLLHRRNSQLTHLVPLLPLPLRYIELSPTSSPCR